MLPQKRDRDLNQFLPAALEILERPPSPVAIYFTYTIFCICFGALVWSWFGWTDVVAIAYGKIQPSGRVKVVQVLEGGKVKSIPVKNGMRVNVGDPLLELEQDDALADEKSLRLALLAARAEAHRRGIAVEFIRQPSREFQAVWPGDIPDDVLRREEMSYRADVENILTSIDQSMAQVAQKKMEMRRLEETIDAQAGLLEVLKERVDMRTSLIPKGAGTRSSVIDALEAFTYQTTILVGQKGQLREAEETLKLLHAERERLVSAFVAENIAKRLDALKAVDDLSQRLLKAQARLARTIIRSPVDGFVHALSANAIGQVLGSGQELMRIVPVDEPLEIEVYLPNKDIGFVKEGQEAAIKLDAFPFTRYGTTKARVVTVGHDAIPEPDARLIEGDPTRPGDTRQAAGAQRTQNLVFPVVLATEARSMMVEGREVFFMPGMSVTSEIKTSQRRLLEYFLSPLQSDFSEAFRER